MTAGGSMPTLHLHGLSTAALLAAATAGASAQDAGLRPGNLPELQARVAQDSNEAQNYYDLAIGYWNKDRYVEADSALRSAIRLDPRNAEAYLALAYLPYSRRPQLSQEIELNRVPEQWKSVVEEADGFYRQAFRLNPLVNLRIIGFAYMLHEPTFEDLSADEYHIYDLFYGGFVDLGTGRYPRAYERLSRLGKEVFHEDRHPDRVPEYVLWYRALAAAHSVRFAAADSDLTRLLQRSLNTEHKPELVRVPLRTNEYRFTLGVLKFLSGRVDSAVVLLQESIANDLGLYMAHVYLATIYEQQQQMDAALLERQRAVDASPEDGILLQELGLALYNQGRQAEARDVLNRAIAANPRNAFPHYVLGHSALARGQPAEAKAEFTRFLELAPRRFADYITDAKARLAALP
jgi:Tfp pilus assembly protein PilF